MSDKLYCIVCGSDMKNLMGSDGHQPLDGLSFHSYGHYGTTFFDPMDDSFIQIAVCDPCLEFSDKEGRIRYSKKQESPSFEEMEELMSELMEGSMIVETKKI